MKKFILFLFAALFFNGRLSAQFGNALLGYLSENIALEDVKEIQSEDLIVMLYEEDEDEVEQLTKKGEDELLKSYRSNIQKQNDAMREAFSKKWNFSKSISFKTNREVKAMVKAGDKEHTVAALAHLFDKTAGDSNIKKMLFTPPSVNADQERFKYSTPADMQVLTFFRIEKMNLLENFFTKAYYSVMMPEKISNVTSITYGITLAQWAFKNTGEGKSTFYQDVDANSPRLITGTLHLNKSWLDDELTDGLITKNYPYSFSVEEEDQFNNMVIGSADSGLFCMVIIGLPVIFDPVAMEIISFPETLELMTSKTGEGLEEKDFVRITKKINK